MQAVSFSAVDFLGRNNPFTSQRARAELGWDPQVRPEFGVADAFAWSAPSDDTLWHERYHWDIQTKTEPVTSARVVDVAAALAAWKPNAAASGKVTIRVKDEVAAWNTGSWQVDFSAGHSVVTPGASDPDVSLDIQAFTQAYHGAPGLSSLRTAGRLEVHSEAGYEALGRLLDGPPMWMNDSF